MGDKSPKANDKNKKQAIFHALTATLDKDAYLAMPMSQLYLFGRPQDYGWAHAEAISVVRSRNHLRLWKAPFEVKGETLWVGAATHDIGFERDERNNGVTHKIDPDIDLERDSIECHRAITDDGRRDRTLGKRVRRHDRGGGLFP